MQGPIVLNHYPDGTNHPTTTIWGNGYRQEHPQKQKWEPFQQMKQAIENCGVGGILDSQTEWLSEVSHGKRSKEEVIIGEDVNGKIT